METEEWKRVKKNLKKMESPDNNSFHSLEMGWLACALRLIMEKLEG